MLLIECMESENCSIILSLLARQCIGWMPMLHLMRQSTTLRIAESLCSIFRKGLYDEHQAIVNRWYNARESQDGATIMAKLLENFLSQSIFCFTTCLWVHLICLISVPFIHQAGAQIRQVLASNDVVHFGISPCQCMGPLQSNNSSRPCT